eukprot:TRINITY_DN2147_c0_g2_i1.p1 TRINITY_DN2147_c0_g2~~TRINITY_DN2147_c0_g2_i1.p1  ORF type:complete len:172 (-),score=6.83 TRINITY_DN2147_c0_g2_i1:870-1385(-)
MVSMLVNVRYAPTTLILLEATALVCLVMITVQLAAIQQEIARFVRLDSNHLEWTVRLVLTILTRMAVWLVRIVLKVVRSVMPQMVHAPVVLLVSKLMVRLVLPVLLILTPKAEMILVRPAVQIVLTAMQPTVFVLFAIKGMLPTIHTIVPSVSTIHILMALSHVRPVMILV